VSVLLGQYTIDIYHDEWKRIDQQHDAYKDRT